MHALVTAPAYILSDMKVWGLVQENVPHQVWILWQDPVEESQLRALGPGSKAMLSEVESHMPLKSSCHATWLW